MRKLTALFCLFAVLCLVVPAQDIIIPKRQTAAAPPAADFATDTFTEPSDLTLASRVPELGTSWAAHGDTGSYPATATIDASTDRIFPVNTSAYYITASPPSADYYVQATLTVASVITANASIAARMDTTANTMIIFRFLNGTGYEIRTIVAGTQNTLGSTTNQVPSVGQSKTMKLVVAGNQISGYIEGVLELGPFTDTAVTAAGKAGVRFSGPASSSTGYHFDDFSAR